jgi:hypothetical protein
VIRIAVLAALMLMAVACSSQSKKIEDLSLSPEPSGGMTVNDLQVTDSGFTWDGETLSYAFTAQNVSEDTSMEETAVQVSVYGTADEAIGSDTGVIDFVLPNQVVAFAGHVPVNEKPDHIALSFGVDREAKVDSVRTFDPMPGKYTETNYGGRVITTISNPYNHELRRLNVVAILRDQDGKILNGGTTSLEVLPAGGESAVTVDIFGKPVQPPARVDVYTQFSAETVFRLQ